MDIDSFNQCLTYAANLGSGKNIDKIITASTTIGGIIIGFLLNIFRESLKKKCENSKKRTFILEDVSRAQSAIHKAFEEALKMIDSRKAGENISGHSLPPKIDIMLVEEYFTSIAHTYTADERSSILSLRNLIAATNDQLSEFRDTRAPSSDSNLELKLHNLLNHVRYCSAMCDSFIEGGKKPNYEIIPIADKLGLNSTFIESLRQRTDK